MPRYYLSIRWDGQHEDLDGEEFDSLEDARKEAASSIRDIVADDARNGRGLFLSRRLAILDENQRLIEELKFTDIVQTDASGHDVNA